MNKLLTIAKWEFFEKIKRKSFIISTIMMPFIVLLFSLLPSFLINKGNDFPLPIGILDFSNKYGKNFSDELMQNSLPNNQPAFFAFNLAQISKNKNEILKYADDKVLKNFVIGYIIIEEKNGIELTFRTNDLFNQEKLNLIENSFIKTFVSVNGNSLGLEKSKIDFVVSQIPIMKKSYIQANSEEEIFKSFINSYLFIILLVTMILFSGGMFVRSLVLEKSNRIIELILSSCTSRELLFGKVLGLSFFGIFQFAVWLFLGFLLHQTNTLNFSTINNLGYQFLFFVLGYILYSAIFIGIGSIVSLDHEAQQLTGYISIFLIFPIILAVEIIRAPNSVLSLLLSYFPLTSAQVMLLRLNTTKPFLEEIFSIVLVLVFSIYLVVFISSKLFRIGILNSGKKPTFKEIIDWLKIK
ncbi:MAG: ABC transporter permease [Ignavibacteriae bacterium]|nr:ABC transporter permease [Ignavibacteriota bacterium]